MATDKRVQAIVDNANFLDDYVIDLQSQIKTAQADCDQATSELAILKEDILLPTHALGLEKDSNWTQPGNTGNTGGGSAKPHGTYSIDPTKGVNGSTRWSISPFQQKGLYDTYYFYKNVSQSVQDKTHLFEMEAKIALVDTPDKIQAWEFNLEDRKLANSRRVNAGLAALFGANSAGIKNSYIWWDVTAHAWVNTNIPINLNDWKAGNFVYMALELAYEPIGQWLTHVAFYVNNTKHMLNQSRKMPANDWPTSNFLQYGFQLDCKLDSKTGMPIGYSVDTMDMNMEWR